VYTDAAVKISIGVLFSSVPTLRNVHLPA